jgi:phage tail tape-measure protein
MLDLFVAAEGVRQKTRELAEAEAPKKKERRPIRPRRTSVRSGSAAALRGLPDLIEPSRADTVSG